MADIIKNTESAALKRFVKITNDFIGSVDKNTYNILKISEDISGDWKGAQQVQFQNYLNEFQIDLKKQLQLLNNINAKVLDKAKILHEIEARNIKG
ncbi:MAG: hypothetical protein IJX17_04920 [Clostridia bacterium]|nr:hypothetical protein [Clostridia bacterium]